jgi:uncharacterized membrane protein YfcA
LSLLHAALIMLAGIAAGTINTVVGSGTLITFPTLLAFGYSPVVANVSNTVGLVPGSISGAIGYRRELSGQRHRTLVLSAASMAGAIAGAVLLLVLPASAFKAIVPAFIIIALVLIVLQPRINKLLGDRRRASDAGVGPVTVLGTFACGIYGGYFGAAQGILMMSILALTINETLQRLNAVKVITTGAANLMSGLVFVLAAHVAWAPAALIAAGSIIGGQLGAAFGRRLNPTALRALIVVVGIVAIVKLI